METLGLTSHLVLEIAQILVDSRPELARDLRRDWRQPNFHEVGKL